MPRAIARDIMSARQKDLLKHIEYPESDGQPMGETDKHRQLMIDLIEAYQQRLSQFDLNEAMQLRRQHLFELLAQLGETNIRGEKA
jgi:hypothetical protein